MDGVRRGATAAGFVRPAADVLTDAGLRRCSLSMSGSTSFRLVDIVVAAVAVVVIMTTNNLTHSFCIPRDLRVRFYFYPHGAF